MLPFMLLARAGNAQEQIVTRTWFDAALGLHTYYVPLKHFQVQQVQPLIMAGVNRALNERQTLELSLRLGYNRHKYQGDALYMQALIRYAPTIAEHFQPMLGAGIGYQLSFYPTDAVKYDGSNWVKVSGPKSVIQVPGQIGLGYRSIETSKALVTPYVAYQVNALFRYSPDLTPLPSSQFLLGIRYAPKK
jgi:hypothetical protein